MTMITMRAARVNAGLSVKDAAAALGITEDTLYRYETGKSSPKIGTAIKMAELYGVTIDMIDFAVSDGSEKTDE